MTYPTREMVPGKGVEQVLSAVLNTLSVSDKRVGAKGFVTVTRYIRHALVPIRKTLK